MGSKGMSEIRVSLDGCFELKLQDKQLTVKELKKHIQNETQINNFNLEFNNSRLEDNLILDQLNYTKGEVIKVVLRNCIFSNCLNRINRVIGTCLHCKYTFCGKHRIPESHDCEKMVLCKKRAFDKNSDKLSREKVEVKKV